MTRRTWIIFSKEFIDNIRDRRAWSMALLFVLMGPGMLFMIIGQTSRLSSNENLRVLDLPVEGADRAPGLMEYLQQRNITIKPALADPEAAIRDLETDVVLVISPTYGEDFLAGRPAAVRVVYDESRTSTNSSVRRLKEALRNYSMSVGRLRLLARGISPRVVNAVQIENENIATPMSRAAFVFSVVPMFLLISLFAGGLYVAIDTMAGERERGSLEPLLTNPITPTELVLGKLLATASFSSGTLVMTALGFALVLNTATLDLPGVRIGLSLQSFGLLLVVAFPLVLTTSSLQMLVASMSRTFKEAQNKAQFLSLLPMIPGMMMIFNPIKPTGTVMAIPLVGQELLIHQILKDEAMRPMDLATASFMAVLAGVVFCFITIQRYDRQRVLFGD